MIVEELTQEAVKRYLVVSKLIHERFGSKKQEMQDNIEQRRQRALTEEDNRYGR